MQNFVAMIILLLSTPLFGQDLKETEVGRLFYVEPKKEHQDNYLDFALGMNLDNTLTDDYSAEIALRRKPLSFFEWGGVAAFHHAEASEEGKQLATDLESVGTTQTLFLPRSRIHATAGVIPLIGKLNFFNQWVFPVEVFLGLGAGVASYKEGYSAIQLSGMWQSGMRFEMSDETEVQFTLRSITDGMTDDVQANSTELKLGFGWAL